MGLMGGSVVEWENGSCCLVVQFFDFGLWGSRSRHGLFDGHVPLPASHHIAKLLVAVKVKHLQNLMASWRARCGVAGLPRAVRFDVGWRTVTT